MGLTVTGLTSSSIDVSSVVTQLMQSESIPQTMLQAQLTTAKNEASTYRAINTKFASLLTAAKAMTDSGTWSTTAATSSSSSVVVSSTGTAAAGSTSFTVTQVATAESQITSGTPYASATAAYGSSTINFVDSSGTATPITVGGSGTLTDAASAINAAKLGVTASVVQVGTGAYQLQVASTTTGESSKFTLDGGTGWSEVNTGQDAKLSVGTTNKYTVTSPTNTITGLLPGVTLTVTQPTTTPVEVDVTSDPTAVGTKMKALVDAANAVLSEISTDTDTGVGSSNSTGTAGPLAGDYTVQTLAQQVRNAVSAAVGTLGSPSKVGVQLNSDGTIDFDQDAFVSALKADPTTAQAMVKGTTATPGIAAQLASLATAATDSVTGTLTTLAAGEDSQAKSLQSQIDDWTIRLTATQAQLTTTYTNMQTMLSSLQNQQTWMTSMFDSLSGTSSSSSSSSTSVS